MLLWWLFQVWDLGGQDSLREAWQTYFVNTQAIIFVVDSCDRERFDLSRKELLRVLRMENLSKAVLLVFANKQDLKQAASARIVGWFYYVIIYILI